jgi:hypothetical protein
VLLPLHIAVSNGLLFPTFFLIFFLFLSVSFLFTDLLCWRASASWSGNLDYCVDLFMQRMLNLLYSAPNSRVFVPLCPYSLPFSMIARAKPRILGKALNSVGCGLRAEPSNGPEGRREINPNIEKSTLSVRNSLWSS